MLNDNGLAATRPVSAGRSPCTFDYGPEIRVTSNYDATAQTKNNDRVGNEGVCSAQQPKPNRCRDEDRRRLRVRPMD
jgi:hypothetical protein